MKKRHNFAPRAPDETSPCLNKSSRRAESESEKHFARMSRFSGAFSVQKTLPTKTQNLKIERKPQTCNTIAISSAVRRGN